ncbi:MAG: 4Fe-4S dicluster domain-containing protein [Candidatus Omnitrophota bacterium]
MSRLKRSKLYGPVATVFNSARTGSWRIVKPQIDCSRCVRCGTCITFCPANVMEINPLTPSCIQIDWNYCKGCGICANVCPKKCIEMVNEGGNETP